MLLDLLKILRNAKLDVTPIEVAETLLLARFLPSVEIPKAEISKTETPDTPLPSTETDQKPPIENKATHQPEQPPKQTTPPQLQSGDAVLPQPESKGSGTVAAIPFRSPQARALPAANKIGGALRPLRRRHFSAQRNVMDVEATVQQIADGGPKTIVWQPSRERWLSVELVQDESLSMHIWRPTLREFRRLLERHGAFRDVRVWKLKTDDEEAQLWQETATQRRASQPDQLLSPTGRQLVIVVSDCTAKAWYHGSAYQMLTSWARKTPTVLTQVLPRSLWLGTSMTEADATMQSDQPGLPNSKLHVQPDLYDDWLKKGAPIPIVTLDEWSIAPWAKMVAGFGRSAASGLVVPDMTEVIAQGEPLPQPTRQAPANATERVKNFMQTASPLARQLAGFLSASPLSLPVLQLVQQAMLPQSRQSHLAEIFRSDLVNLPEPTPEKLLTEETVFDFHEGVRDELLRDLTRSETLRVLDKVEDFICERSGQSSGFQALLAVAIGQTAPPVAVMVDPLALSFARIKSRTLRKIGVRLDQAQQWEEFANHYDPNGQAAQPNLPVLPETFTLGDFKNDPWKGVFGGLSEHNHRRLTATVEANPELTEIVADDLYDWFSLTVTVSSTNPSQFPLQGEVQFFLHLHDSVLPTKAVVFVSSEELQAEHRLNVNGAFTIGVVADGGATRLELDLAQQTDLPYEFRYPLKELLECAVSERAGFTDETLQLFAQELAKITSGRSLRIPIRRARALTNIGNACVRYGNDLLGITFFEYALRIVSKLDKKALELESNLPPELESLATKIFVKGSKPEHTILIEIITNLGAALFRTGDVKRAIEFYEQALSINREKRNRRGEGYALNNLGTAYESLGELHKAIELYQEALIIYFDSGDHRSQALVLSNLGSAYKSSADLRKAIEYYEQALAISREIQDRRGEGNHLGNLGLAYSDLGEVHRAIEYYEQALTISRETADFRNEALTCLRLAELYEKGGIISSAISFAELAFKNLEYLHDPHAEQARELFARLQATSSQDSEHYDCLIAYSTKDFHFASRLQSALKDKGIHCLVGKPLDDERTQFQTASSKPYDKVLLCLSSQTLLEQFKWAKFEAEKLGANKLFPLLLGSSLSGVKNSEMLNLANFKLQDNVLSNEFGTSQLLDFRDWESDESVFQKQVNVLANRLGFFSLTPFTFTTVTLDKRGKEIERKRLQANQFIEELAPDLNFEMLSIPGGTFLRGSPETEKDRSDNETQHKVTVSPFYMGKFTITQEQWRVIAADKTLKVARDLESDPAYFKDKPDSAQRPVERVSWEDAEEFCARLAKKTGRAYRLPTEAEWEYACRAGTMTPFAFGETITPDIVNYDGKNPYAEAPKGKYRFETVPVGSLGVANAFGLFDMHGNVWEWCQDWYGEYEGNDLIDPTGVKSGSSRVLRGGSYLNYAAGNCRAAARNDGSPVNRYGNLGFRCVISARTL